MIRHALLLVLACTTISCAGPRPAPPPEPPVVRTAAEEEVLAVIQRFFDTMAARDSTGSAAVLDPEGDFLSIRWNANSQRVVRRASNADYLATVATEVDTYLERMWDPTVRIHGAIATVWTPYDFHVNGEFSHCGVDAFQLLRADSGWMITGGTYTVERTGCAPSPLGPPTD